MKTKYSDLFQLYDELSELKLAGRKRNADRNTISIAVFHYHRAKELIQGISVLLNDNLFVEAQIILRALLNLYFNIKWINNKDTKNRMQRFIDYDLVFRKKAYRNSLEYGYNQDPKHREEFEKSKEFIKSEQMLKEIMKKYKIKSLTDVYSWAEGSIKEMAEELEFELDRNQEEDAKKDLKWQYRVFYAQLCTLDHTNPSVAAEYYSNGQISFEPDHTNLPLIFIFAFDIYLNVYNILIKMIQGHFTKATFLRLKLDQLSIKYLQPRM